MRTIPIPIKGTSLTQLIGAIAVVQEGAVYLDPQIARAVISHLQPPRLKSSQIVLSPREFETSGFVDIAYDR